MNSKQKIAIVAPLVLIAVMVPVFQILARAFADNWRIGWYLGLVIYWIIWGAVFPLWIIGRESIRTLIQPQKINLKLFLIVIFPALGAAMFRLLTGMEYGSTDIWTLLLLLSTTPGNGFFEEILWRGVYMKLFPANILLRIIWPSIGFALWHYAPGAVAPDGNALRLIIGAAFFGFYLSFLAKKTNTVWWCILAHALGGIVMVV